MFPPVCQQGEAVGFLQQLLELRLRDLLVVPGLHDYRLSLSQDCFITFKGTHSRADRGGSFGSGSVEGAWLGTGAGQGRFVFIFGAGWCSA